ncbi:Aste57867_925 [Aphanomyces stellatus]|uniref:Aste57867_925 protein n=1 Tax=Aphanomyces stellatus TaxID=120398 RepID=A0A485K6I9_9STRA|nr:hypothetical protein As57867_000924 [Aphanomyces stellatus]VFT78149.1 Aste57867_925 [Aphanomyces stellatus]
MCEVQRQRSITRTKRPQPLAVDEVHPHLYDTPSTREENVIVRRYDTPGRVVVVAVVVINDELHPSNKPTRYFGFTVTCLENVSDTIDGTTDDKVDVTVRTTTNADEDLVIASVGSLVSTTLQANFNQVVDYCWTTTSSRFAAWSDAVDKLDAHLFFMKCPDHEPDANIILRRYYEPGRCLVVTVSVFDDELYPSQNGNMRLHGCSVTRFERVTDKVTRVTICAESCSPVASNTALHPRDIGLLFCAVPEEPSSSTKSDTYARQIQSVVLNDMDATCRAHVDWIQRQFMKTAA